jgi:hypothetical protein
MTTGGWRTIFDVSERFPTVVLGWLAVLVLLAVVVLLVVRATRPFLLRRWWLVLIAGAAVLSAFGGYETYWFIPAWALLSAVAIAILELRGTRFRWSRQLGGKQAPAGFIAVVFGTALLFMAGGMGVAQSGAIGLSQRLADGRVTVLSGPVTNYSAGPAGKWDCFSVQNQQFCFSDAVVNPGFNRTQFFGSPLRDGTLVRISAVGGTIARLEVAASP